MSYKLEPSWIYSLFALVLPFLTRRSSPWLPFSWYPSLFVPITKGQEEEDEEDEEEGTKKKADVVNDRPHCSPFS